MKKRAGSFFKSVLSKSKNLFTKKDEEEESKEEGAGSNDFDSEEDHDIIEVGKTKAGPTQMPANSLMISNNNGAGAGNAGTSGTGNGSVSHERPAANGGLGSTKHLLMEFATNTL
jgi:hypothetical protein